MLSQLNLMLKRVRLITFVTYSTHPNAMTDLLNELGLMHHRDAIVDSLSEGERRYYAQTCIYMPHQLTCTPACTCTCTRTHMHMHMHMHTYTHTHKFTRTCNAHSHAKHTHIFTHLHAIHTNALSASKHFTHHHCRRVKIGQALIQARKILLLDEPTTGLDENNANKVCLTSICNCISILLHVHGCVRVCACVHLCVHVHVHVIHMLF